MSIDWETDISDVFDELSTRNTVNFIITADHNIMTRDLASCSQCGKFIGTVIAVDHDNIDFECLECSKDVVT